MHKHFDIINTKIEDLKVIQRNPIKDKRGFLSRIFCPEELNLIFEDKKIAQINHTYTNKSRTIRGMHFQFPPYSEKKLITCIRGEVFDVALDLRQKSSTFLKYHFEILSENNYKSLYIPEGFAHGFQTLVDNCELIYVHSTKYEPNSEGGIKYDDPIANIKWPFKASSISDRDAKYPILTRNYKGITS